MAEKHRIFLLILDLSNGYKSNTSKLLKNETLMLFLNDLYNEEYNFKFRKKDNEINIFHTGKNNGYIIVMGCYPMLGECFIIMVNYISSVENIMKAKQYIKKQK
jgi:hypothetical protein